MIGRQTVLAPTAEGVVRQLFQDKFPKSINSRNCRGWCLAVTGSCRAALMWLSPGGAAYETSMYVL